MSVSIRPLLPLCSWQCTGLCFCLLIRYSVRLLGLSDQLIGNITKCLQSDHLAQLDPPTRSQTVTNQTTVRISTAHNTAYVIVTWLYFPSLMGNETMNQCSSSENPCHSETAQPRCSAWQNYTYKPNTTVTFREVRRKSVLRKSNWVFIWSAVEPMWTYIRVQLKFKLKNTVTCSAAARPPCRLCYRPAVFSHQLRLAALLFPQGKIRLSFKNVIISVFLLF